MAQLSRPYQIALLALGLFAAVWFTALHRPGSSSPSEASGGSSPANHAAPATHAASAATPGSAGTPVYHGSAPGVAGLTRDIARAHGAVAQSEQNAAQLQSKSAQASSPSGASGAASTAQPTTTPVPAHHAAAGVPASHAVAVKTHRPASASRQSSAARATHARLALRARLAHELAQGKVLLLFFWNPHATDDAAVRHQLSAAAAKLKGKVAVHVARASQVGQYTSVTREVQVYGTPTLLVVARNGQASTLTGLLDAYSIEQAVSEARQAAAKK